MARSLIPALLGRDWWDVWDFPHRIFDQHFGLGLTDEDLFPLYGPSRFFSDPFFAVRPAPRRWLVRSSPGSREVSEVRTDPDKFQVMLDVKQFKPNEIEVKTVGDNTLVIHAKHEERPDEHGFVCREFTRRYVLPEGVELKDITSSLSTDGVLSIEAPKKKPEQPAGTERVVPIQVTQVPQSVTQGGQKPQAVTKEQQEQQAVESPKRGQ